METAKLFNIQSDQHFMSHNGFLIKITVDIITVNGVLFKTG